MDNYSYLLVGESCPKECSCSKNNATYEVNCSNLQFNYIPKGIPNFTTHLDLSNNNISKITVTDMPCLPVLTHLDFSWNTMNIIDQNIFANTPELLSINLEHTRIQKGLNNATFRHTPKLVQLNLNYNSFNVMIIKDVVDGLNKTHFKSISLDFTGLSSCAMDIVKSFYNTSLEELSLRENGIYFDHLWDKVFTIYMPKLKYLDISYNIFGSNCLIFKDLLHRESSLEYLYMTDVIMYYAYIYSEIHIPANLKHVVMYRCILPGVLTIHVTLILTNVTKLDWSYSPCLQKVTAINCTNNLPTLKYIDIAGKDISDDMKIGSTCNMSGVQYLGLADNNYGVLFTRQKTQTFLSYFDGVLNLDLSMNAITKLYSGTLATQSKLEILSLTMNKLTDFEEDISHMKNLKYLHLSNNKFQCLSKSAVDMIVRAQQVTHSNLSVDMYQNPFQCSCNCLYFYQNIYSKKLKLYDQNSLSCKMHNTDQTAIPFSRIDEIVSKLSNQCHNKLWLYWYVIMLVGILSVQTIAALVYRFKYHVMYAWFKLGSKVRKKQMEKHEYTYDAFIAYNHKNFKWVRQELLKTLEEEAQDDRQFKFCIHHKDFLAGIPIVDNIIQALEKSRHAIFVVSDEALRSEWWEFELQMAHQVSLERSWNTIICVFLEEVSQDLLPSRIERIFNLFTCLKWPTSGKMKKKLFWRNLSKSLTHHKNY